MTEQRERRLARTLAITFSAAALLGLAACDDQAEAPVGDRATPQSTPDTPPSGRAGNPGQQQAATEEGGTPASRAAAQAALIGQWVASANGGQPRTGSAAGSSATGRVFVFSADNRVNVDGRACTYLAEPRNLRINCGEGDVASGAIERASRDRWTWQAGGTTITFVREVKAESGARDQDPPRE